MRAVCLLAVLGACTQNIDRLPDHDGDGYADAFDNCPSRYDPSQDDGDGDGVGDACDPHVASDGDAIVHFAFFDHGLAGWVPDTIDNWSVDGDEALTVMDADSTQARLELDADASSPTIALTFVVKDYGPAVARRDNAVQLRMSMGALNVSGMVSNRDDGNPIMNVIGVNSDNDQVGVADVLPDLVNTLRLTFDAGGTHIVVNESTYEEAIPASDGSTALHASILVFGQQVALQSAVVYRSP